MLRSTIVVWMLPPLYFEYVGYSGESPLDAFGPASRTIRACSLTKPQSRRLMEDHQRYLVVDGSLHGASS